MCWGRIAADARADVPLPRGLQALPRASVRAASVRACMSARSRVVPRSRPFTQSRFENRVERAASPFPAATCRRGERRAGSRRNRPLACSTEFGVIRHALNRDNSVPTGSHANENE